MNKFNYSEVNILLRDSGDKILKLISLSDVMLSIAIDCSDEADLTHNIHVYSKCILRTKLEVISIVPGSCIRV